MIVYVGDLEPTLEVTITRDGSPVDLTTATGVTMTASLDGQVLFTNSAATVTDATNGVVQRAWQTADTDTAGLVSLRVTITWPTSRKETIAVAEAVRILA